MPRSTPGDSTASRASGRATNDTAACTAAREEERARLARDLHDGPAQTVGAARMALSRLAERHPEVALEPVILALGAAFEELRRVSRGLRPLALEGRPLATALADLASAHQLATGVPVSLEVARLVLPRETEAHILRLTAEALSNCARHSGARTVDVRLSRARGEVTLTIEDDGAGFDAARVSEASRGGLLGMSERARAMGGRLEIEARPGRGARIEVRIPAASSAAHASRRLHRKNEPPARPNT